MAHPAQYPYYSNPPFPDPKKKQGGCGGCLWAGLIGAVLLIAVGVGGYLALNSGVLTQYQLLAWVGRAPAEINIINLGEKPLSARLIGLDESETANSLDDPDLSLEPLDMDGYSILPGRYRLELTFSGSLPVSCTLRASSGDFYQFSATAAAIFVSSTQNPARSASDLRVPVSPLCQK